MKYFTVIDYISQVFKFPLDLHFIILLFIYYVSFDRIVKQLCRTHSMNKLHLMNTSLHKEKCQRVHESALSKLLTVCLPPLLSSAGTQY